MTTNGCRAAVATPPKTSGSTHLTITFALGGTSVEAATELAARWLGGEIGGPVRPIYITSVRVGEASRIPEPARLIAAHRRRLHLTQQKVAELAGVTQTTVSNVERGRLGGDTPSAIAIRRALADAEAAR